MASHYPADDMSPRRAVLIIGIVCVCETLGMATYATFPTLFASFRADWALSSTQIGWIGGSYFAGVAISTVVLPALTDRLPAKTIYLAGMAISFLAALGFAFAASGFWTSSWWRFVQGIGLGGTYLPGLRALLKTLPAGHHDRATAFYTSTFYVGASLSYFAAGELGGQLDWQRAFAWSALGPAAAFLLAAVTLRHHEPSTRGSTLAMFDFRPLLRNRAALGYTIAYGVHTAELLVIHTWLVAFLVFSQGLQSASAIGLGVTAATLVALINLAALPASIGTNELSARFGRIRLITPIMICGSVLGVAVAALAAAPFPIVLLASLSLFVLVTADSASITNGLRSSVPDELLGRALAVYSVTGFLGGAISPVVFGLLLDIGGGPGQQTGWISAHLVIGLIFLIGPIALLRLAGPTR